MENIILMPCSGRKRLNIPRGHVYHAKVSGAKEYLGFITEENAKKKYGEDGYYISMSDSLCPICHFDIEHGPKLVSLETEEEKKIIPKLPNEYSFETGM